MEEHQPQPEASSIDTSGKKGKKKPVARREKKEPEKKAKKKSGATSVNAEQPAGRKDGPGFKVSEFDHCVENHFRAIDAIAELCGEAEDGDGGIDDGEIQRFSSSTVFLRCAWLHVFFVCSLRTLALFTLVGASAV